jgi:hypothetical protein
MEENLGSQFVLAISRSSLSKYGEALKKIPEIMVTFAVFFFPKKKKKTICKFHTRFLLLFRCHGAKIHQRK